MTIDDPSSTPSPASGSPSNPGPSRGGRPTSPAGAEIVPERLIYRPASWFEPLPLATMFPASKPIEVELGSGDGSFLLEWAERHPEVHFLGVERLLGRIRKIDRKAQRRKLGNLLALRIEASYCLEYLLPPESVRALHLYFPDPWPKRKHWKNRLVNERFPELAARVLQPGASIHLRTDHAPYFEEMVRVFQACPTFTRHETPPDLLAVTTDFERDFLARGIPTCHASYARSGAAGGPPDAPVPNDRILGVEPAG